MDFGHDPKLPLLIRAMVRSWQKCKLIERTHYIFYITKSLQIIFL